MERSNVAVARCKRNKSNLAPGWRDEAATVLSVTQNGTTLCEAQVPDTTTLLSHGEH